MNEQAENTANVLTQKDSHLPEYLDFKNLRKEALEHIGLLAGKVWTDHNLHDPGITTLEVLIYALMDLGYRTNLPFKDLIAPNEISEEDDNFLTPLKALTINPTTITDYRKLLLEIKGVRNAWLEPVSQEVPMYLDPVKKTLVCGELPVHDQPDPDNNVILSFVRNAEEDCFVRDSKYLEVHLNGLYKVYVEKDPEINREDDTNKLLEAVRKKMASHRNICEDVEQICILDPLEIGLCAEVDIMTGYDPEKIYMEIVKKVKAFIQPELRYYTLQQLLDKGKSIDEIFAGRPYSEESHGFVDTEELESLPRRNELHTSDLYTVLLGIEGVRRVSKLHFKGGKPNIDSAFCKKKDSDRVTWSQGISLTGEQVPVFSMELTCVDLFDSGRSIYINQEKVLRSLVHPQKFLLPKEELDCKIPYGNVPKDLGDFESIQTDFPLTYGIGEDGLPDSATLKRKAQALQFKGYLMFFDQLFANYTAQLSHIRSVFALTPEKERHSEEKHTYFTDVAKSIPEVWDLVRFYTKDALAKEGTRLAIPVIKNCDLEKALERLKTTERSRLEIWDYCDRNTTSIEEGDSSIRIHTFPSAAIRKIYVSQMIDSFFNDAYTIEVHRDKGGYFFVLDPNIPDDIVLAGIRRFGTYGEAQQEAKNVGFLSALENSYNLISDLTHPSGADFHYFNISYNPLSYLDLIQGITEQRQEYLGRRKQFLDHLLARFGEQFTDYALLRLGNRHFNSEIEKKTIEDQSTYIDAFADTSRNRGKAFNYLETSWGTDNVSGYEKRTSLLSGMGDWGRTNLCNFEVTPCFKLHLKDWTGKDFFSGKQSYESRDELYNTANELLTELRASEKYPRLEKSLNEFRRDAIRYVFAITPAEINTEVSKHLYSHQLLDANGNPLVGDKKRRFKKKGSANEKKEAFIERLNCGEIRIGPDKAPRLISTGRENEYLDTAKLDTNIEKIKRYRWEKSNSSTSKAIKSAVRFSTEEEAWDQLILEPECNAIITRHTNAQRWTLRIRDAIKMHSALYYPDRAKATSAWRQAKVLGNSTGQFKVRPEEEHLILELRNEKGKCIAESDPIPREGFDQRSLIEDCIHVYGARTTRPRYEKAEQKYGFKIPIIDGSSHLISYNNYDSQQAALKELQQVYVSGTIERNYLRSGDEGNPEYTFLLRDEFDAFIAQCPESFETSTDRDSTLNKVVTYLKKNKAPLTIKPEPLRYSWTLKDGKNTILASEKESTSLSRAQEDLDRAILKFAEKAPKLLQPHMYWFGIKEEPSAYVFVYGVAGEVNGFQPLFRSQKEYNSKEEAETAYSEFVKHLPALELLKSSNKKEKHDFAMHEAGSKVPLAIQYLGEKNMDESEKIRASYETAKAVTSYLQSIYTKKGTPRERFIKEALAVNREGQFEWRFLKKNAPLAHSPYRCDEKQMTASLKKLICGTVPPIALDECPPKNTVVCPQKDKGRYHYQVCFTGPGKKEFVLYSFRGYASSEKAEAAWQEEWFDVIQAARDLKNYGPKGLISLEEVYGDADSSACKVNELLAVVPDYQRKTYDSRDTLVRELYMLAHLYPIYKLRTRKDDSCSEKYIYRVTHFNDKLRDFKCDLITMLPFEGSLLWESTECFTSLEDAIEAYRHFYHLVGIPTNCRILCEKDKYYVGLLEVLVESLCSYTSEEDAWDTKFPDKKDSCQTCIPGGVRQFIYAGEDDRNYIPVHRGSKWSFKVVAPEYYVVDHSCSYDSEDARDRALKYWLEAIKKVNWSQYITWDTFQKATEIPEYQILTHFNRLRENPNQIRVQFCEFVQIVRECLPKCVPDDKVDETFQNVKHCIAQKLRNKPVLLNILNNADISLDDLFKLSNYFPVYKTDSGYCFRLYWPENDLETTPEGLPLCGCGDENYKESEGCKQAHVFTSSRCYPCCEEALKAFVEFCNLVEKDGLIPWCTEKSPYGPYSFQLVNPSMIIGYHPQRYLCAQDMYDAINRTRKCLDNDGMHLLEHILLRPQNHGCQDNKPQLDDVIRETPRPECCTLPVCPDFCCDIEWHPDTDEEDPCADDSPERIYYLPGSDPYSFWATLVLPSWSKPFRTLESRKAYESFLFKEAPALVAFHILWLSPRDMCEFEDAYRLWLEWRQNPCAIHCQKDKLSPLCRLVTLLRRFRSEDPCLPISGGSGQCNCHPEEKEERDPCCLPPEHEGTLFWGFCDNMEKSETLLLSTESLTETAESGIKVESAKATVKKLVSRKRKKPAKATSPVPEKDLLKRVRARKPGYLQNMDQLADEAMLETKSYKRAQFFVGNAPTLKGYSDLASFFARYSLQKDNNKAGFIGLIENASMHLFDHLVLERKRPLSESALEDLQQNLLKLKSKGLSLKKLSRNWQTKDIEKLTHKGVLIQIRSILK